MPNFTGCDSTTTHIINEVARSVPMPERVAELIEEIR